VSLSTSFISSHPFAWRLVSEQLKLSIITTTSLRPRRPSDPRESARSLTHSLTARIRLDPSTASLLSRARASQQARRTTREMSPRPRLPHAPSREALLAHDAADDPNLPFTTTGSTPDVPAVAPQPTHAPAQQSQTARPRESIPTACLACVSGSFCDFPFPRASHPWTMAHPSDLPVGRFMGISDMNPC
jgi:hypothetical protein